MRYNIISYFIGEGFKNVFKNKKSTFSCLGVMCATMLIFGLFFAIGENVNHMIKEIEDAQGMQIFMNSEASEEEIQKLGEELNKIEGINTIEFETKEEAYNRMKKRLADREWVMEGLEPSIFSVSYIITLTDLSLNAEVKNKIYELDNVKRIQNSEETIEKLANIANGIRIVTGAILVVLILISIFIISNTIKLTVHARRKEISIMKYVGATNAFIRSPFIVEGIVIGILSGLLSILLISGVYNLIANKIIGSSITSDIGISILNFSQLFTQISIVYMVLGVGIGVIGSSISMRKYLDV